MKKIRLPGGKIVRSNPISRKKRLCNHPNFDKRHVATMQHLSKRPALFCPAWSILSTDAIALWIWTYFVFVISIEKQSFHTSLDFSFISALVKTPTHILSGLWSIWNQFFIWNNLHVSYSNWKDTTRFQPLQIDFLSFIFGIWCDVVSGCPDWWVNKIWPITEVSMPIERKWSKKAVWSHRCLFFQTWRKDLWPISRPWWPFLGLS